MIKKSKKGERMQLFYMCDGEIESREEIKTLERFIQVFNEIKRLPEVMGGTVWRSIVVIDETILDETFGHPIHYIINKRVE